MSPSFVLLTRLSFSRCLKFAMTSVSISSASSVMVMADILPIEADEPCPLPSAPMLSVRRSGELLISEITSALDSAVDVSDNFSSACVWMTVDWGRR